MDDYKSMWQSSTIWGAIITLVAASLTFFGIKLAPEEQQAALDGTMQVVGGIGQIIGLGMVVLGRIRATKLIG